MLPTGPETPLNAYGSRLANSAEKARCNDQVEDAVPSTHVDVEGSTHGNANDEGDNGGDQKRQQVASWFGLYACSPLTSRDRLPRPTSASSRKLQCCDLLL